MRHNKSLERDFFCAICAYSRKSPSTQALRHHKVQHRDQQQRFRHLRLMTEHDLAMLYEWLNRSHIVVSGGAEKKPPDTC